MDSDLRSYRQADENKTIELALRAWTPVFASMEEALGHEIFTRLHGDNWRRYQENSVRGVLQDEAMQVWVADRTGDLAGFVVATVLDLERGAGHSPARRTYEKAGYTMMPMARYFKAL